MGRPDDFDIIEERPQAEPGSGRPGRATWWLVGTVLLVVFGFAVGIAFSTVNTRLGGPATPTPAPTDTAPTVGLLATATAAAVQTATAAVQPATPTAEPAAATATAPPTPTQPPPTATPTPCPFAKDSRFPQIQPPDALGCALAPSAEVIWAAHEPFERGSMLWRSDTNLAYVFYDGGRWSPVNASWDGSEPPSRGEPPSGLVAPERGFGWAWATSDELFSGLGWALAGEKGFCAEVQEFERGFILQSTPVESCTPDNLYNQATAGDWSPVLYVVQDGGQWAGAPGRAGGETEPAQPTLPTAPPPPPVSGMPAGERDANGVFRAPRIDTVRLDGSFDEWSNNWLPLTAVVHDVAGYGGGEDLAGSFQAAWSPRGLWLALQVQDDVYRSGPGGTDMWQGDGIEINFDRLLAEDFAAAEADADDYQIGVSFGPDMSELRGYRWLPFEREAGFNLPGALAVVGSFDGEDQPGRGNGRNNNERQQSGYRGYLLEALLPWELFEMDGGSLQGGEAFGFNLALNDNDGDTPAQQTVISASPARTRHDNPTQWGALYLMP